MRFIPVLKVSQSFTTVFYKFAYNEFSVAWPKRKTVGAVTAQAEAVTDYRHSQAKRKNNPPAKMAAEGVVLYEMCMCWPG
jgi:hypothetical protein